MGQHEGDRKSLVLIIILAIILVFGVMAGTYESFKDPFINLFTLPFIYSLFNKGADKKDMSGIPQELIDSINGSEKE